MSKVYSFRLDEDNPREAQAGEVIEAWAEEGYSLRHVVVEALIAYKKTGAEQGELTKIMDQLHDLISNLDRQPISKPSEDALSNSFLDAVKKSARVGVKV
jgi:hypothetical protein